jgi:tetratricopeptide (TPR) repeat protein
LRAGQVDVEYGAENMPLARDLYLRSLEADPRYAPAWARLGRIYRIIGKYGFGDLAENLSLAEEAFQKSFALHPDLEASAAAHQLAERLDPNIQTSVPYTYQYLGEYQKALDCCSPRRGPAEELRWSTIPGSKRCALTPALQVCWSGPRPLTAGRGLYFGKTAVPESWKCLRSLANDDNRGSQMRVREGPLLHGLLREGRWRGKRYCDAMVGFTQPFFITPCDGRKLR